MATKVKGLLKGLRYISHIFETEKEQEMQIGVPTDVKHVAHIGFDGPSASTPSWMTEFKNAPKPPAAVPNEINAAIATSNKGIQDLPPKDKDSGAPLGSPTRKTSKSRHLRESSGSTKPRRRKSSAPESPTDDSSNRSRRHHSSSQGSESPSMDQPVAKPSRRRKSKGGSSSGGSTRSKSQDPFNDSFPFPESSPACGLQENGIRAGSGSELQAGGTV